MAESYSVKAILSATDRGFSSTLKSCSNTIDKLNGKVSGLSFGFLTGAGMAAFNTLTSGVSGLIGEIDDSNASWKTFEKNMAIVEKSEGKLEKSTDEVKKELQDFAQKTVYSSSDMASTYAQLAAVGTKNTSKLVKGFGGLAAAAENPQQAMKTLSQQATQMAAKPNVAWQDFKLMLEQTPAGIAAVAKEMGMTTAQLVTKVQDGSVKTEKFFDAIQKVGTNDAFTKLATEAKTMGQAMDGAKETLANKLLPAYNVLSKVGIGAIDKLAKKMESLDSSAIVQKVSQTIVKLKRYWEALKESFSGVRTSLKTAFDAVKSSLEGLVGSFGSTKNVEGFKGVMEGVANAIKKVAEFVTANSDTIANLITYVPHIFAFFQAFKASGKITPIIGLLIILAPLIEKVGKYAAENSDKVMEMAKAFGTFVAAKKAYNFIKPFASGIGKIATTVGGGLAQKLFGVAKGTEDVGKKSSVSGKNMISSAKAFALMGVGVLAVAVGFALLAQSSIALANAGGLAIGVMAGMVVGVAALGLGMALLLKFLAPMGAQLMPVATAMLAMGAAVVLVSAGFALLAVTSIQLANAGGGAIAVMVGMVAAIALLAVGAAALAPALTAGAVGLIAFGAAMVLVGAGALLAAAALAVVSAVLPTVASYGMQGATAIVALGVALVAFAAGAITAGAAVVVLSASMVAFGAAAVVAGAGALVFAAGMTTGAAGTLLMVAALKAVSSQMKTISKNAKTTQSSLKSMQRSVKAVESGLNALGSKAKAAMKTLTSAFDRTEKKAKTAGKNTGTGFTKGMQSGLNRAPAVAGQTISAVISRLRSGYGSAYSCGAYISQGFAAGMESCLGRIRSVASEMAEAAEEAIRAKAKIYSPNVATPNLAYAYAGEMSGDYSYYRNSEYVIEVPLSVDGREFARATATYTQEELNKQQTRNNRKNGRV